MKTRKSKAKVKRTGKSNDKRSTRGIAIPKKLRSRGDSLTKGRDTASPLIFKLRQREGWSQEQTARLLKCSTSMISHYETGRVPLKGLRLEMVKDLLKGKK